ncbi:hypothetical protein HY490_03430 [Candidatus Woesearchaeota archaeon]|nr:hypothetical protein [Candidatus Woesearchaeota archaeon]
MRWLIIALVLLVPTVYGLSRADATTIVLTDVVENSPNKNTLTVYRWPAPVFTAKETHRETLTFEDPVWYFWIDDQPGRQFAHSNRYVFVHQDGFVRVSGGNWQPEHMDNAELVYVGQPRWWERVFTFLGLL